MVRAQRLLVGVTVLVWVLTDAAIAAATSTLPPEDNPFLPEDRSLSECISAVQRPGCGSEARGGTAQTLLLVALIAGLAFIGWRVYRSARATKHDVTSS